MPQECPYNCEVKDQLEEILSAVQSIQKAFPEDGDGEADFSGHRRFHEAKIAAAEAEAAFWRELKFDLARKGAIALLTIIAGLIVLGLSVKLGIGGKP